MIPIRLKIRSTDPPPAQTHYLVARNGLFLCKREWWVEAVAPVGQIAVLEDAVSEARLLMPALPAAIFRQALGLAQRVYEHSASEVCCLLHYQPETGYQLSVPKQRVSPGYVKYHAGERLPGHLCVGTIHSHGVLTAYHSPTDHSDEEHWDGVHVTVGSLDAYPQFSLSAEIVVAGNRFPVDPSWFERVVPASTQHFETRYFLDAPDLPAWEVPPEWWQNIRHPTLGSLFARKGEA